MVIFRAKPRVNPFGEMSIFRILKLLVFIAQKGVFSFQNIVKDILVAHFSYKKEVAKMAIFVQKPWVNPFGKTAIFRLFKLIFFFGLERRFFVLEYRKRYFRGLYCLKKKTTTWKNGHFCTNPWVNLVRIMSIFRLFELLVFIPQKNVFSFQNIVKDFFLAYIAVEKKSWKNGHFWTKCIG